MKRRLAPEEMYPAGIPGVRVRRVRLSTGIEVRVAETGGPRSKPIVFLHGWGASIYMWRHALARLPTRGYRVIACDLRGFGLSDKPAGKGAYKLDTYVADARALLDALELERPLLAGQSMGGAVAFHTALRMPDRVDRLVMIAPSGVVRIPAIPVLRTVPRPLATAIGPLAVPRATVALILRHIAYGDGSLVTDRDVDEYWAPSQFRGFIRAARTTLSEFSWEPVLADRAKDLGVPALLILGAKDRLVRVPENLRARLRQWLPVHVLPGGHCVAEEHPDAVYSTIADWVTGS